MPTYEYACRQCGEHVEVVQSFRDDPLTVCGLCGGPLRKVFGAAGIIFKGSGYYVTDSRRKAAAPAAKGKDADAGDSGAAQQSDGQRPSREGPERQASDKHESKRRESGARSSGGSSSTGAASAAESA
jgi:putative FmdB family regulatory protein